MKKGDIVLLPFPFTDLSGIKHRPAIVLVVRENDITVTFITTQIKWQEEFDFLIHPDEFNSLKKLSLVKLNKIATLDIELILGKLGTLNNLDMNILNKNLLKLFKLESV